VLAVMRAKDFDDAVRIANGVAFGLSASVQTRDISRAFDFVNRIEAGLVTVNLPSAGVEYQLPFGGTKDSSVGPKSRGERPRFLYGLEDGVSQILVGARGLALGASQSRRRVHNHSPATAAID